MKALKIALVALGCGVVLLSVLFVTGMPIGFLLESFGARMEKATGYRLQVGGGASIRLWPSPTIELHDVRVLGPGERNANNRFAAESIKSEFSLREILAGRLSVGEIVVVRPLVRPPLIRRAGERYKAGAAPSTHERSAAVPRFSVARVSVVDGALLFVNDRSGIESRIDRINGALTVTGGDQAQIEASAHAGKQPVLLKLSGTLPDGSMSGKTVPLAFTLDLPGLLKSAITAEAQLRLTGTLLAINGMSGTIGSSPLNGWASVDFTSKPFVKLDVDLQRLDVATIVASPPAAGSTDAVDWDRPWSDVRVDLDQLNFFDAELQLSASELNIGTFRLAPVGVGATLSNGIARLTVTRLGAYRGQAEGALTIDASSSIPHHAIRGQVRGARALPLLSDVAGFTAVDGRMEASFDLQMSGSSQRELFTTLSGNMGLLFQDGELRYLNVARVLRELTTKTFSGWQDASSEKTDFTELSAVFQVANGKATTNNLRLVSPLVRVTGTGSAEIVPKTLQFKFEPKIVPTLQGQGGPSDLAGLGVPVIVAGTWGNPTIYPDIAGIMDNPAAAFSKLREFGATLLGDAQSGKPGNPTTPGIGQILDQFLGDRKGSSAPGRPSDVSPSDMIRQFLGR